MHHLTEKWMLFFETGHALGLVSEDGVELFGTCRNRYSKFKKENILLQRKKSGDTMKKGDILLEFDIDKN